MDTLYINHIKNAKTAVMDSSSHFAAGRGNTEDPLYLQPSGFLILMVDELTLKIILGDNPNKLHNIVYINKQSTRNIIHFALIICWFTNFTNQHTTTSTIAALVPAAFTHISQPNNSRMLMTFSILLRLPAESWSITFIPSHLKWIHLISQM